MEEKFIFSKGDWYRVKMKACAVLQMLFFWFFPFFDNGAKTLSGFQFLKLILENPGTEMPGFLIAFIICPIIMLSLISSKEPSFRHLLAGLVSFIPWPVFVIGGAKLGWGATLFSWVNLLAAFFAIFYGLQLAVIKKKEFLNSPAELSELIGNVLSVLSMKGSLNQNRQENQVTNTILTESSQATNLQTTDFSNLKTQPSATSQAEPLVIEKTVEKIVEKIVEVDKTNYSFDELLKKYKSVSALLYSLIGLIVLFAICVIYFLSSNKEKDETIDSLIYSINQNQEELNEVRENYDNTMSLLASTCPIVISDIDVKNGEQAYGKEIYARSSTFITPKIKCIAFISGNMQFDVKFYAPYGLSTGSESPKGYSYSYSEVIKEKGQPTTIEFSGWGGREPGHWSSGNYRIEIYHKGKLIGSKSFTIK